MAATEGDNGEFYLRYYVGHRGKFGHEFLEFEFRPDGKLRYANNSNYKNDTMIRKEVFLTPAVLKECRRIISESEIMKEDDNNWPEPDRVGKQELEIVMGNEHISFTTSKIGSLVDVHSSQDPEGLRIFYYLVQFYPKLSKVLSMLGLMNISWTGMSTAETKQRSSAAVRKGVDKASFSIDPIISCHDMVDSLALVPSFYATDAIFVNHYRDSTHDLPQTPS
ncbi:hypothetical protein H0E87_004804 [Populus deltoides]|uniref:Uncharacterized protein n=1 Tax=Populus deltoides TaxID=3696 RepID=A0A8T2ZGF7_POPDE|nr:hypothetical protein H0E87_004804 [Populus deltoides]